VRTLLFFILFLGAVFFYVDRQGGAIGYAPFTPVYYWNYSGDARYQLRALGVSDFIKISVEGNLSQGSLEVWVMRGNGVVSSKVYSKTFGEVIRIPVQPGYYDVVFRLKDARGRVRYDWVTAKNEF